MRSFRFVTADVFTRTALEGNQVAVITDARGLRDAEMQAIARETKFSETTFVIPRDPAIERERGVKVRIFTVKEELPFAGHPTLGTAFVLRGSGNATEIALDLAVGRIPVAFSQRDGAVFGEMVQRDPEFGQLHDPEEVARVTGLKTADLDASLPIETVTTGNAFAIVPIRSLAAIRELSLEWRRAEDYLRNTDANFFYFVTCDTGSAARLHARMIFYGGEDPATGSAAGPAAAWMVKRGIAKSDEQVMIEQGIEALRPSQIFARATRTDAGIRKVRVGGYTVQVMTGEVVL